MEEVLRKKFVAFVFSFCMLFQYSFSQSSWQKLGPGGGGATFLPTFSYHTADCFFIRCDMTGSYLTNYGGESYQQINFDNGASGYAFDPYHPEILYAGSAVLHRSADGGKTWQQVFPKLSDVLKESYYGDHAEYQIETNGNSLYNSLSPQIKNIHVDPVNQNAIYFSMGNYFYYSLNNCASFDRIEITAQIESIYVNNISPVHEIFIFTAGSLHIFNVSSKYIREVSFPKTMSPAFSFCGGITKNKNTVFYALHYDTSSLSAGQYRRTDIFTSTDGFHWNKAIHPLITNSNNSKPNFIRISCAEFDAEHAYAITDMYEEKNKEREIKYYYGAIKTNDAGKEWHWVFKAGGGSGQYGVKDAFDAKNIEDAWASAAFGDEFIETEDIGVYPNNGNVAVLTDWYRTMKTTDGGKSWKEVYSARQSDKTYSTRGLDVTNAYGIHFDPFDSNHIAISYTDIGFQHSYNKGKSWKRSVSGVPLSWQNTCYWIVFDKAIKNKLWSAWSGMHDIPRGKMTRNPVWKNNYKGGICVSEDGGNTWKPSNTGMGDDALITSIAIDEKTQPGNRTLYATAYNRGVFKSTDDGKTWQLKNKGINQNTCAFKIIQASNGDLYFTVSITPNHESENNAGLFYSGAVYKSTDGAESWQKLQITNEPLFPNGIAVDPDKPDRIYLTCWAGIDLSDLLGASVAKAKAGNKKIDMQGGIFLSQDGGKTWASIFDPKQYVYDITVDPFYKGRLYCNTFNKAAYRSDNYGTTWQKIKGYDFHWGHRVIADPADHEKVYITTYGSSIWHGKPEAE